MYCRLTTAWKCHAGCKFGSARTYRSWRKIANRELSPDEIWNLFQQTYMGHETPYALKKFSMTKEDKGDSVTAVLRQEETDVEISGDSFGTLGAFVDALEKHSGHKLRILNYAEHALSAGTRAEAIAYVEMDIDGSVQVGVSTSQDTVGAMFKATLARVQPGSWERRWRRNRPSRLILPGNPAVGRACPTQGPAPDTPCLNP